jgi:AraC-like DNA-binding protein
LEIQSLLDFYNNTGIVVQNVYRVKHKPGLVYAGPTISENYGMVFTLSGMGRMQFNDAQGTARNGVVFHGGPDCWHEYATMGDKDWDMIIIAYDVIGSHDRRLPDGYRLNTRQTPEMKNLLIQLHMMQTSDMDTHRLRANGMFYTILSEMFSNTISSKDLDMHTMYNQISSYIKENCTQDLDMYSVAKHFGIKENRLYYIFQKYSDIGPAGFLRNSRMDYALELLKSGGMAVEDVALTVRYSDGFSFSKQFKKKYGIAPSFYQKMYNC